MLKDKNLIKIKEVIKNILPHSKIILFGSRAKKDFDKQSDYDVLVIIKLDCAIKEKICYESNLRLQLAKKGIDADIIVKDITSFAVRIRYADDFYEPDIKEVKIYYELAKKIRS